MKRLATLLAILILSGCNSADPVEVDTETKFITPEQRAKMPIEERDDPYTRMHSQQKK